MTLDDRMTEVFPAVSRTITSSHFINLHHFRESIDIHRLMNAISMKYFRKFIEKLSWLKIAPETKTEIEMWISYRMRNNMNWLR